MPSARLRDSRNRCKIKVRSAVCRLVHEVYDDRVLVLVIAVGKRERSEFYRLANRR